MALLIGYARCSTDEQDLTAQRDGLLTLGVAPARVYVDHGLTGTNRDRPGLREALAACREGDTLVVTKLDRLARSLPDARAIAAELTARQVRLSIGASVYDPTDPVGRLLFNVLAMVAEFESDLIRLRTREGRKAACQRAFAWSETQAQRAAGGAPGAPAPVSTAPPNSPSCSVSAGPPCTEPWTAAEPPRPAPERTEPAIKAGQRRTPTRDSRGRTAEPRALTSVPLAGYRISESFLAVLLLCHECEGLSTRRRYGWRVG